MTAFYDLKANLPNGEKYDFATLKGKVVLIVNTASAWYVNHLAKLYQTSDEPLTLSGFTPQYKGPQFAPLLGLRFN